MFYLPGMSTDTSQVYLSCVEAFKEARKGFLLLQCLWNEGRLQRRILNGVGKLYVSLQLYCWAKLWGYLWRHISYHGNAQGPQKLPLNFSFCKLSEII